MPCDTTKTNQQDWILRTNAIGVNKSLPSCENHDVNTVCHSNLWKGFFLNTGLWTRAAQPCICFTSEALKRCAYSQINESGCVSIWVGGIFHYCSLMSCCVQMLQGNITCGDRQFESRNPCMNGRHFCSHKAWSVIWVNPSQHIQQSVSRHQGILVLWKTRQCSVREEVGGSIAPTEIRKLSSILPWLFIFMNSA